VKRMISPQLNQTIVKSLDHIICVHIE